MIIFIGLVIVFLAWSFIKAKARIHHANKLRVARELNKGGSAPYPTWVNDESKMEEFIAIVKALTKRKSIPEIFVGGLMTNELGQNRLFFTAGLMEQQGASVSEQTLAVVNQIEEYWLDMDINDRASFQAES